VYRCGGTYIVPSHDAVGELHYPVENEEGQVHVEEECACWCIAEVFVPHMKGDFLG